MMKNIVCFWLCALMSIQLHAQSGFDIQGHRGARGLYPENSIVGFIEAVNLGVNTLEMDIVVTKDNQLLVSHDPWMGSNICLNVEGEKEQNNIYEMTYEQISKIDCGSKGNEKFPEQKKMFTTKPLLLDVVDAVEKHISDNHLPKVFYNIETKTTPDGDGKFHPAPAEFVNLLYDLLKAKGILERCIIQSFDVRTLQVLHQKDASVKTALLVFDTNGLKKNVSKLGFTPTIYSPNFILVNKRLVKLCHEKGIMIIPWTVNEEKKMLQLKSLGVDGLISDYPDKVIRLLR